MQTVLVVDDEEGVRNLCVSYVRLQDLEKKIARALQQGPGESTFQVCPSRGRLAGCQNNRVI